MYYIIGDIGNSSTRICLLNKSKIKNLLFLIQKNFLKIILKKFLKKFFKKNLKKEILFSCVVP